MMRASGRFLILLLTAAFLTALTACDDYPKDPGGTLERVRGGIVRAGHVENPPWAMREDGHMRGSEVELVERFAASLDATVEWSDLSGHQALRALKEQNLDIVVGGFVQSDPWSAEVGFTRPYIPGTKHVMAVPNGENAWLVALERFLKGQAPRNSTGAGEP